MPAARLLLMYEAIKKTRTKIGRMARKGSDGEDSYRKPPKRGPIENPNPGATIAKPTAAPWLSESAFREAAAVYPGVPKPMPSPIIDMPRT